jgi:tetratricopeptide (TPR) repeat protein
MMNAKAARVAALLVGTALFATTPAHAQTRAERATNEQVQRQGARPPQPSDPRQAALQQRFQKMPRPEQQALLPLVTAGVAAVQARTAGQTPNWAPVQAAIAAAQPVARSNEAKYFIAQAQLEMALGAKDTAAQEQALTTLLSNPVLTPEEQATYRRAQGVLINKRAETAFAANDFATAERLFRELLQANPGDQRITNNLRIVQERMGNSAGALQSVTQQIQQAEANGGRATEDLYRRAFQTAYRARQRGEASTGLQRLLRNYPNAANWRTGVDFVRENARQDTQYLLDAYRFARAANVIQSNEYLSLAQTLDQAGLPGEVKAVVDAGVAAGALQSSQGDVARLLQVTNRRIGEDQTGLPGQIAQARRASTGKEARIAADVLYGYGRYQEAAELYRLALTKSGEDANLLNTRLGASLAMAGQRAQAEAALRAVTGSRAELANLWLAWLARSPA